MRYSRSRIVFVGLALMAVLAFLGLRAPVASAASVASVASMQTSQGSDSCPLEATIPSLQACVQHAAGMGLINNQGVTRSLLAKLDGAQAAAERGQPQVAVDLLDAFVREVRAQAGKHIDAVHAAHMITHAQLVIQALQALEKSQ